MLVLPTSGWSQGSFADPFGDMFGDDPFASADYEVSVPYSSQTGPELTFRVDAKLTPDQQAALEKVQPYMSLESISRTPAEILNQIGTAKTPAVTSEKASDDEKSDDESEDAAQANQQVAKVAELQSQLVRGDWQAVKEHLAELPEAAAPLVYSHIVTLLAQGHSIRPDEIPEIASAAPGPLSTSQCYQLGALLAASMVHLDQPRALFARLREGVGGLGGKEPASRAAAARMLLSAGMIDEATKYVDRPSEINDDTPLETLELCSELDTARYLSDSDPQTLADAWRYTVATWTAEAVTPESLASVTPRLMTLLAAQPTEFAVQWVVTTAQEAPSRLRHLLTNVLQEAAIGYSKNDVVVRSVALKVAAICGNTLSDPAMFDDGAWKSELTLLAIPWMNEVLKYLEEDKRLIEASDDDEVSALDAALLGRAAPEPTWRNQLPSDTGAMANRLGGCIAAANASWDRMQESVSELAQYDVETAQQVIDRYLGVVVHQGADIERRLEELMKRMQRQGYTLAQLAQYRSYYRRQLMEEETEDGEGIALTRAHQIQSLEKLKEILQKLAASKLPAPTVDAVTNAFMGVHSSAEIFMREDLEAVFGPLSEIPVETSVSLGKKMRTSLAGQWRDLRVQQVAGTNRNEKELFKEVTRGYELALALLDSGLENQSENLELQLLSGLIIFDQSEYLFGQGADLPTYIKLRDQAFSRIAKAADLYAKSLAQPDAEASIEVFQRWFQLALGASDLAYLTRQSSADQPQIQRLASSIRSLGDEQSSKHLEMFANALDEELDNVPPPLKQRCLSESLAVLGDHPAGERARELDAYYGQLLDEVELHTAIDGSSQVGHGKPFGMRLSVRYSTPMGREADDFLSLTQKHYDSSGTEVDNKKKLEEEIRDKLEEDFLIEELCFYPPTTKRQLYGREGWRETPLVYLVLSAKDPAVDTIAPLQVDVMFRDGHGSVLLPIVSEKLLIDAREVEPASRPYADLKVKQLLDARELASGNIRLEIVASATGLVPKLNRLVDLSVGAETSGFVVTQIEDHGIAITEFEKSSGVVQLTSERTWFAALTIVDSDSVSVIDQFAFPALKVDAAEMRYEQYADADIVQAESVVPLRRVVAYDWSRLVTMIVIAIVVVLVGLGIVVMVWRRRGADVVRPVYSVPAKLTPFSLVAFLRRIASDQRLSLSATDRVSLQTTIAELETRFFAAHRDLSTEIHDAELRSVFERWHTQAQKQYS
jgi:hypothetical protein